MTEFKNLQQDGTMQANYIGALQMLPIVNFFMDTANELILCIQF